MRGDHGAWAILAYPAFDAADIWKSVQMIDELERYGQEGNDQVYVGESTVYASMYILMRDEWPLILGMSTLLIAAIVFWQLRSVAATLLTLMPLGLGLWWLLGLMGLFGLRFSLFSVPILPAVLGIGVDNAVYLVASLRASGDKPDEIAQALSETGAAIWAATATTGVGFASFLAADSGGLRSIGMVAVLGIVVAAASAVLTLPTLTLLGQRRREYRAKVRAARQDPSRGGSP